MGRPEPLAPPVADVANTAAAPAAPAAGTAPTPAAGAALAEATALDTDAAPAFAPAASAGVAVEGQTTALLDLADAALADAPLALTQTGSPETDRLSEAPGSVHGTANDSGSQPALPASGSSTPAAQPLDQQEQAPYDICKPGDLALLSSSSNALRTVLEDRARNP